MYLNVVPVILNAPDGRKVQTYGLLDSGSHVTILSKLKLEGRRRSINIGTIRDNSKEMVVEEVALSVQSRDGKCNLILYSVFVLPKQSFKVPSQPYPANYKDADIYTHLDGIELQEVDRHEIAMRCPRHYLVIANLLSSDCLEAAIF